MKFLKQWALMIVAVLCAAGVFSATTFQRFTTSGGGQFWLLEDDGSLTKKGTIRFGDSLTSPTLPTIGTGGTGGAFGLKVPFYNGYNSTMTQGDVVVASATASNVAYGSLTAALSTTSVVGICEGTVASGSKGYMTVAGYALAKTSGPVYIGDPLVTTNTATGYLGRAAAPTSGTDIGVAMSTGNSAGGLTLIRLR